MSLIGFMDPILDKVWISTTVGSSFGEIHFTYLFLRRSVPSLSDHNLVMQ